MSAERKPIVLASASPRRRALLAALGLEFDVVTSDTEEHVEGAPHEMVTANARAKRDDVAGRLDPSRHAGAIVLAADTLVFVEDQVLGKPADLDHARAMLRLLAGRTHQVLTGVAVVDTATSRAADGFEATGVTFADLAEADIEAFVGTVRPLDRAGAYTVDGPGSLLVERYDGCYQNVLGLPIVRLDALMRTIGHSLSDLCDRRRATFL